MLCVADLLLIPGVTEESKRNRQANCLVSDVSYSMLGDILAPYTSCGSPEQGHEKCIMQKQNLQVNII